jgi:hypothetical protein
MTNLQRPVAVRSQLRPGFIGKKVSSKKTWQEELFA